MLCPNAKQITFRVYDVDPAGGYHDTGRTAIWTEAKVDGIFKAAPELKILTMLMDTTSGLLKGFNCGTPQSSCSTTSSDMMASLLPDIAANGQTPKPRTNSL